jgi:hypothetical protein
VIKLAKGNSTKWFIGLSSVLLFTGLVDFTQQSDQSRHITAESQPSASTLNQGTQTNVNQDQNTDQSNDGVQQEWQSSTPSDQSDSPDQSDNSSQLDSSDQSDSPDQLNSTDQSTDSSSVERPYRRTRAHTRAS